MQTRSTDLFSVSLAVGAFGALTGRLFTWLVMPKFGFDFGLPASAYAWVSPVVLFASAAAAFAFTYGVFPGTRGRARRAGWVAGVITYVCHSMWIAVWSGVMFEREVMPTFSALMAMFIVIGWLPIVSGIFAGLGVERWQRSPAKETQVRLDGETGMAALKFGLVGALVSVPLIFVVYTMARRSRVPFVIFFPSAPFIVFGLAAVAFWLFHSILPAIALRGRVAGVLAALATFIGFLFWIRFGINISNRNGQAWGSAGEPFSMVLLLVGWVPVVLGGLAGGWATRRVATPVQVL
ncbi:MAG: hypothetical protein ABI821_06435 [Pseudomonadota bacterium]